MRDHSEDKVTNYAKDLAELPNGEEISETWSSWLRTAFPGVSVEADVHNKANPVGKIRMIQIGPMRVWSLLFSGRVMVRNHPEQLQSSDKLVTLVFQKSGASELTQGGLFRVKTGAAILTNNWIHFSVESFGMTHIYLHTLPETFAKRCVQLPELFEQMPKYIDPDEPMLGFFIQLIERALEATEPHSPRVQAGLLSASLALLNALPTSKSPQSNGIHWRVKRALEKIESAVDSASLSAEEIAAEQHVTRRWLDQLFLWEIGSTISSQILEKRLTTAAASLCDPAFNSAHITTIALASGFQDSAHFSRAFKKRFGHSPRKWRQYTLDRR